MLKVLSRLRGAIPGRSVWLEGFLGEYRLVSGMMFYERAFSNVLVVSDSVSYLSIVLFIWQWRLLLVGLICNDLLCQCFWHGDIFFELVYNCGARF